MEGKSYNLPATTSELKCSFNRITQYARRNTQYEERSGTLRNVPLILIILFFVLCSTFASCAEEKICIKDACVKVEIADSPQKREQGLMFRQSFADNQGMLFIFDREDKYAFWMKNMNFPLDIIWINEDNIIVDIKENVPPCGDTCEFLAPKDTAKYVLEVNSGFTEKHSIHPGDKVVFDIIK